MSEKPFNEHSYLKNLVPKVFRTEGDVVGFEPDKITQSLIRETGLDQKDADKITELVIRRIISSGIKFLSGPHIREIVCSILSEQHFEEERKLYTRIGMPLMDYEEILEKGIANHRTPIVNPEKIHHRAANRISEEYALLRILDSTESHAHLFGDIHIHKLRFFDLRPMSQIWDARIILKQGLPPLDNYIPCCNLKPAKSLREAIHQLVKWLILTQNEFCGTQGFRFLTTFLAPYAKGIIKSDLVEIMRNFVYEINHLSIVSSRYITPCSLYVSPNIPDSFLKVPAIGSNGKAEEYYEDCIEESENLFNALTDVFIEGDDNKGPFKSPKHEILLNSKWIEEYNEIYSKVWDEISKMKTPILINANVNFPNKEKKELISSNNNIYGGILQEICINLPRFSYISKDEDQFIDIIDSTMNLVSQILMKKYETIKKRLNSNFLPLSNTFIDNTPIYRLEDQMLSISFVGLNEAVKSLTDFELHEHLDAFNLGKKILAEMNRMCVEFSKQKNIVHVLSENISRKAPSRFAKSDLKHYPKKAIPHSNGDSSYYTNSAHFRKDVEIDLYERIKKQEAYHYYIQNGAIEYIYLKDLKRAELDIEDLIRKVFLSSKLAKMKLV
ncbi:MAG: anaerobic ribonucleoside-triphosphate reductase [Candidatus Thorarchaeota archaeon]